MRQKKSSTRFGACTERVGQVTPPVDTKQVGISCLDSSKNKRNLAPILSKRHGSILEATSTEST